MIEKARPHPPNSQPAAEETSARGDATGESRPEVVERLFREHNKALLSFITSRLHSPSEAREIAQEAYVKLLGLNDLKAVSYLQAYLYRIAGNLITDRMRRRDTRTRHEHFVFFDENNRESDIPSPEAELIEGQERQILEAAVAELPPRLRLAFIRVELDGHSIHAVAEELKIKPESVRQFVHRSYEFLAGSLAERVRGEAP